MIGPSSTAAELLAHLAGLRNEDAILGMRRFGIQTGAALGISNPVLQRLARLAKRDHARARLLWESGVREARLLALYTADPKQLSADEARAWAQDFASWEIVDTAADLFVTADLHTGLIPEFAADDREFVRRSAFAMIAGAAVHRKQEPDASFGALLPLIQQHATDPRNFVKKAVNWALRAIGKRSHLCNAKALALAQTLAASPDATARWIGRDALRELSSDKVLARLTR